MTRTIRTIPALAVILAVFVGGVAQAADPQAVESGQTEEEAQAQLAANELTVMETVTEAGETSAGCTWRKTTQTLRTVGGVRAMEIWQRGTWCWRRGKVTSVSWSKGFFDSQWVLDAWNWKGWAGTVTGGGVGQAHVYRRITGHFELCIFRYGCLRSVFPWVAQTLRGDGTIAVDAGAGGWGV